MTVTFTDLPLLIIFTILVAAYALLGIVYAVVWLDIWRIKHTDPERYARFRDLRNARKGKR